MKKLTRLLSLVLALGLIFVSLPQENASAAGLCVNPGGTAGCYATIGAAVNAAAAGDTITVASGTYTENVLINKSLTLSGSGAVIDGNGAGVVVVITANNVTLEGFTIQHSGSDAQTHAGVGLLWAQGCTVRNNTIAHNIHGIALMSASSRRTVFAPTSFSRTERYLEKSTAFKDASGRSANGWAFHCLMRLRSCRAPILSTVTSRS